MAVFNDFLTIEGETLLARALAGECNLTFTKMILGDGENTKDKNITDVVNPKITLDIYSVESKNDNTIHITSILSNSNLSNGFYLREKGVYATDGKNEILMLYANCGSLAEWIEASTIAIMEKRMTTVITISNSDKLNITLQSGLYATSDDINKVINIIQNNENSEKTFNEVKEIRTYLTDARAAKLDLLDVPISTCASASTALSNMVWTDARANRIDELLSHLGQYTAAGNLYGQAYHEPLNQKTADIIYCLTNIIKPLLDAILNQANKIGTANASIIKSVQRGSFYCTRATETIININSVNTSKSIVLLSGIGYTQSSSTENCGLYMDAFESTKITFKSSHAVVSGGYSYQVIEFY